MNQDIQYLNESVWCTLGPSKIHGIGVFAIRDIPKGQHLTDHHTLNSRELFFVNENDFEKILPEIRKVILDRMLWSEDRKDKLVFYSPNTEQSMQSFMNHSPEANSDGHIALRDIKKGEEITENYKVLEKRPHRFNKANFDYE